MTLPHARTGNGLLALAFLALGSMVAWFGCREPSVERRAYIHHYPALFSEGETCRPQGDPIESARRSEEHARLREDRYAYDPREGVRAVRGYQEADACYQAAGQSSGARRARRAGAALTHRVNTDYAAARLNLSNALEREQWSVALGEIRRLLLLTEHVGRHEYVDWLNENIGRVTVEASAAP
jgi:hypothetical protein